MNARLNPLAKKPPNGPITELNTDIDRECSIKGYRVTLGLRLTCNLINYNNFLIILYLNKYQCRTILVKACKLCGSTYSCGLKRVETSQSIVIRPKDSLYSIGHTKYRYWHITYDI